jgi:universal stress protein A
MRPKRILCPTDFSPPAEAAVHAAADLARDSGAELTLVHVYQWPIPPLPEVQIVRPELLQDTLSALEQDLAAARAAALEKGAPRVDTLLLEGSAWHRIVDAARERGADLVIVGTHGRTGLRHVLLGSVAEKVVRHAPCSVLVVRRDHG